MLPTATKGGATQSEGGANGDQRWCHSGTRSIQGTLQGFNQRTLSAREKRSQSRTADPEELQRKIRTLIDQGGNLAQDFDAIARMVHTTRAEVEAVAGGGYQATAP